MTDPRRHDPPSEAPFHRMAGDSRPPGRGIFVKALDGVRLRLAVWRPEDARSTVLLFPGRTEYVEKYAPVVPRLTAAGHAVLAIDWRGQGMSDRLLPNPRPGHIADFAAYRHDVAAMLAAARALRLPGPFHLLAHSMGGCIGLAALLEGLPVASAAFSAPMWGIWHAPLPGPLVLGLARTAGRLGRGGRSAVGTGGDGTYVLDAPFRGNALTGDAAQWARLVAEAGAWPHLTLGGATYDWLQAALSECVRLAAAPAPDVPALIGLGLREAVVSPAAIRARAARWPQARLLELPDARHELMFEAAWTPGRFLDAVLELFGRSETSAQPAEQASRPWGGA